jgi:UDP-glucuronate 4-epimerase
VLKADIRQPFHVDPQSDVLIHLAALTGIAQSAVDPSSYLEVNVLGTLNVLEQARKNGVKRIIYASSSSVYTPHEGPVKETDHTMNPLSFYGSTKKMSEVLVENYCRQFGMTAIGLRFFTVYGSWTRPDMAAYKFMKAIEANQAVTIYQAEKLKRDFTHVSDIVHGIKRLMDVLPEMKLGTHEVFNIGFGQPVLVKDFAGEIARSMGKELIMEEAELPKNEVLSTHADTEKLQQFTGFKPQVSVQEGVREMVTWFKTNAYE